MKEIMNMNDINTTSIYDPLNVYRGSYREFIESILNERPMNDHLDHSERHHVIPVCCGGKDDDSENMRIHLTYREHFIAHKLLAEENPDNHKLFYAYWRMCNDGKHVTPEEYEIARMRFREIGLSVEHRNNISKSSAYRPPVSEETRRKLSNSWSYESHFTEAIRKKMSEACIGNKRCLGYKHTEETRKKMSESRKGKSLSEETRQKISKSLSGKELSPEHRSRISASRIGNKYRLGTTHSVETRKKLSESAKHRVYHNICKCCNQSFEGHSWNDYYCQSCREGGSV